LLSKTVVRALQFLLGRLHFLRILPQHFLFFLELVTHGLRFFQESARALVDFDVENGPCQDQTEFLYEVYLRRVELPESGKLQNTITFLIRDKRYDKNTRGPLVAENPGRNGHILFRNLGAKDSIFFCNGLSYQALGKLEPLLQIL